MGVYHFYRDACFVFYLVVYFHFHYARCPHHCCPSCRRHRHHHYHVLCCHQDIPYLFKKYEINVFYLSITVYIPKGLGTVRDVGTCFSVRVRLRGVRTCFGYSYGAGTVWVRYGYDTWVCSVVASYRNGRARPCTVPVFRNVALFPTCDASSRDIQYVLLQAGQQRCATIFRKTTSNLVQSCL